MAKVNEIVVDALENLVTQADETPIEASEGRAAIRTLNDMMAMWAAQGVNLGYTNVADLGDTVTVAPGAILGIKANLAIHLAPKYGLPISPELRLSADIGWKAILDLAVDTGESAYPETLPQGSGNDPTVPFFTGEQDTILDETGGAIAVEADTEEA